jgi:hypothetical protein
MMNAEQAARRAAMERLSPLVGEWNMESSLAPPGGMRARTVFEWALGEQFLVQRAEVEHPDVPDGLSVIAFEPQTRGFTQHYFDSRGVVRVYSMTFDGGVWTLQRDSPDFTPLDFAQRFVGEFSEDGASIRGRWETRSPDRSTWEKDFDLTYVKVARPSAGP